MSIQELLVLSWRLDANNYKTYEELKKICEEQGYSYMVWHITNNAKPGVLRDRDERWIGVLVKKGGMIVLPVGIYHHFTLDTNNYIKAMWLFIGDPVWTPFNRPHNHPPPRLGSAFFYADHPNLFKM
ncbi:hypothetical protein UlMin_043400 [Ulmus minor]